MNYFDELLATLNQIDDIAAAVNDLDVKQPDDVNLFERAQGEGAWVAHPGDGRTTDAVTVERVEATLDASTMSYTLWLTATINGKDYTPSWSSSGFRVRMTSQTWRRGSLVDPFWVVVDDMNVGLTEAARERLAEFLVPFVIDVCEGSLEHLASVEPKLRAVRAVRAAMPGSMRDVPTSTRSLIAELRDA